MSPPRDRTACQTCPCKCKICISSIESDVYNKKKIQMFVANMTFISSSEVKYVYFMSAEIYIFSLHEKALMKYTFFPFTKRHSWNIYFFTSRDEIKVIFTPNIWISSIMLYHLSRRMMKRTFRHVRPAKTQNIMRIGAVWSESSMSAWRNFASLAIQEMPSEDYDQTAWICNLIWIWKRTFSNRNLVSFFFFFFSPRKHTLWYFKFK